MNIDDQSYKDVQRIHNRKIEVDPELDYQQIFHTSQKKHEIKSRQYKKMKRQKLWLKRIRALAIATAIAVTLNAGCQITKHQQLHTELMLDATNEMAEVGYHTVPDRDGNWDYNYQLLKDVDLIKLYALMGADETEMVLREQGYKDWSEFLEKSGYENREEWRKSAIDEYKQSEKQRGGK